LKSRNSPAGTLDPTRGKGRATLTGSKKNATSNFCKRLGGECTTVAFYLI